MARALVVRAGACALACAGVAGTARADDGPPLLPLASVQRPPPLDDDDPPPHYRGCADKPLPVLRDRLPFGPGELLSYDVAVLGIRTGKVNIKMGERAVIDGVATFPLQAQAKTDGFLEVLGNFDARMVSFFDPSTLTPVRMVNRTVTRKPFVAVPVVSREDGAFAKGVLNARLRRTSDKGDYDRKSHITTAADVVDLLSVVYYLRARVLPEGAPFCFELYHRRRLWHVEGKVGGIEVVRPPLGARRARRLDAVVTRVGGKHRPPPRPVTAWITDDADRVPVLVSTPDKLGHIEVRMLHYERGHRLVAR